jgi:hypothetical protein
MAEKWRASKTDSRFFWAQGDPKFRGEWSGRNNIAHGAGSATRRRERELALERSRESRHMSADFSDNRHLT